MDGKIILLSTQIINNHLACFIYWNVIIYIYHPTYFVIKKIIYFLLFYCYFFIQAVLNFFSTLPFFLCHLFISCKYLFYKFLKNSQIKNK